MNPKRFSLYLILFLLLGFIFLLLLQPVLTLSAASRGLLLWFYTLLPTLLPFLILTNIVNEMFPVSQKAQSLFTLCMGLLCGFPLGAKLCSDGLKQKRFSKNMAQYLLPISNMASPAFLITYIFSATLGVRENLWTLLLCMYLPIVFVAVFSYPVYFSKNTRRQTADLLTCSITKEETCFSIHLLDESIMNGFEIITKLGGYMILFSILGALLQKIPMLSDFFCAILLMLTEITTGSRALADLLLPQSAKILWMLPLINLGGLSFLAQTAAMIRGSGLRLFPYFITKAIIAAMTAFFVSLLVV